MIHEEIGDIRDDRRFQMNGDLGGYSFIRRAGGDQYGTRAMITRDADQFLGRAAMIAAHDDGRADTTREGQVFPQFDVVVGLVREDQDRVHEGHGRKHVRLAGPSNATLDQCFPTRFR
ncbi:MAG TPA: hypothetical protein VFN97_11375 [Actinospica sp.]|nr:hypothetical protein [Actinospica sp.]